MAMCDDAESIKEQIKEHVAACLPGSFKHKLISSVGDAQSFHVAIASNVSTKSEFETWLEEFKDASKTEWNVARTNPAIESNPNARLVCHLEYECCHSRKNKKLPPRDIAVPSKAVKNFNCPAVLDVTIKKPLRTAMKNDSYLAAGYPCTIQLGFNHNHVIENSIILAFRRAPSELKEQFFQLFSEDNLPAEAIKVVVAKLKLRDDYDTGMLADAALNPKPQTVYYWHRLWRLSEQGDREGPVMWTLLQQRSLALATRGSTVLYQTADTGKPMAIAIITPIMRRAHALPSAKDIAFVDSTATCDDSNHVITFMLTSSPVGAVPLGVVITDSQSSAAYEAGFSLLKEAIGSAAFQGQEFPSFLIRDDSKAEGEGFAKVWPNTTQLLCIFHVLQAHWRYLWSAENAIQWEHRQQLMRSFTSVVNSSGEEEAFAYFDIAAKSITAQTYPHYIDYVMRMWERREEWCKAYRMFIPDLRGHHTNNYSEASIRLFKDLILSRCKAFNSLALVDYITIAMEEYYEKRLLDFAHGRNTKAHIFFAQLLAKAKSIPAENVWPYANSSTDFQVRSASKAAVIYDVNTEVGMCSCYEGCFGKFCKHQAAVWKFYGSTAPNMPAVRNEDYYNVAVLALGAEVKQPSFYGMPGEIQFCESAPTEAMDMAAEEQPHTSMSGPCPASNARRPESVTFNLDPFRDMWGKLGRMIESNIASDSLQKCVAKFVGAAKRVRNESQLQVMLVAMTKSVGTRHKHGKRIGVQPASVSRRAGKKTHGRRRLQPGRPQTVEQVLARKLIAKAKKRRPNFSLRVKGNKR